MASREGTKKNHSLRDFGGVNTQSARQVIGDNEFAWLENVMPIGHGNMKALPSSSASLAILTGESCYWMATCNLANVDYIIAFCASGAGYKIQANNYSPTYAVTKFANSGTFSASGTRFAQWKNERILIIDPAKGYFDYDGTTLTSYAGTVFSVTIGAGGINFTYSPTVTPSSGTSAYTATIGASLATIGAAGTGYAVNDVLTLSGGTGTAATITVSTVSGGAITGFNISSTGDYSVTPSQGAAVTITNAANNGSGLIRITAAGHGYSTGNTVLIAGVTGTTEANGAWTITVIDVNNFDLQTSAFVHAYVSGGTSKVLGAAAVAVTGGHGTGATFTPNMSITKVVVSNPGSGYSSAPTLTVTLGGGSGASLTANLSSSTNGTSIEVYSGRVFIANNRTIVFSAPASYTDFTTASYGGSFIMTDSTLKSTITRLFAANNYLYIFGRDSVNVLSDVRVSGTATVFSNTNISTSAGTDMSSGISAYYRAIFFPTDYGIYAMSGVTPNKVSPSLDGMYGAIDLTQDFSCGLVSLFGVLCIAYLVKYNDPSTGTARQLLMVFFSGKWFFATQLSAMTFICPGISSDTPVLYATDGLKIYKLFSDTSTGLSQTIKTRLWDMGDPLVMKQALKLGMEFITTGTTDVLTATIDTEYSSQTSSVGMYNVISWQNGSGMTVQWQNGSSNAVQWIGSGYVFRKADVSNFGNYVGITTTSSAPGATYMGMHLQYEERAPWMTTGT